MLDYDLVILGGSLTGRYAALLGSQIQGRIALVEPEKTGNSGLFSMALSLPKLELIPTWCGSDIRRKPIKPWIDLVRNNCEEIYSHQRLGAGGVDVIVGEGEFIKSPRLGFKVNNRILRSRNYLLAPASTPKIPPIEGLLSTGFITPETLDLFLEKLPNLSEIIPQRLAIIGGDPKGIELAQYFARLGLEVIIITPATQILAQADPDAVQLIQCQLEAEGVKILTQTPIIQVKKIADKKWIQAGNTAIEVDEILVAYGSQTGVESLNLSLVGVEFKGNHLWVNQKLQTTNPRIYGCGQILGGYPFEHIAQYEAQIALKNSLYWRSFKLIIKAFLGLFFLTPN